MAFNPEYSQLTKNDTSVRSWKDLKKCPIESMRHYHCALVVESNSEFVGVYHHPASDVYGEAAITQMSYLKKQLGNVSTSCVIHRSRNLYSQADLIHEVEKSVGIIPRHMINIDLSNLFQEDTPVDIIVTDKGIYAKMNEHVEKLVSSMQLKQ